MQEGRRTPNGLGVCKDNGTDGVRHLQQSRVARWPIFRQNWPIFADFKVSGRKKKFLPAKHKKAENRPILEGPADKMPIF